MSQLVIETQISNSEDDYEYKQEIQLLELQRKLYLIKNERKRAESQISTLANRLNLLKNEEIKVQRKVADTKNETLNKTVILENLEYSVNNKLKFQQMKEKRIKEAKEKNKKRKEEIENKALSIQHYNKIKRQDEVLKRKEIKNSQNAYFKEMKNIIKSTNKSKSYLIKSQLQVNRDRYSNNFYDRKEKLKRRININFVKENKLKEDAEKTIQKMTEEENSMLFKIKTTNTLYKMSKFKLYLHVIICSG